MTDLNGLAVNGGAKTIENFEGVNQPKIGMDEFMELVDTWGYSPKTQEEIRKLVEKERNNPAPHLARYYHPRVYFFCDSVRSGGKQSNSSHRRNR